MTIAISLDLLDAHVIGARMHATLTLIGLVTTIAAGPLLPRVRRAPLRVLGRPRALTGSTECAAMATMAAWRSSFEPSRSDQSPGRELLAELIDYFNEIYPGRAARPGSVTTPDEMVAPHGVFLVGYENGEPIAIGGLRPLEEDGVCEIKRMYVVPAARSRGAGTGAAGRARGCGARHRLRARPARRGAGAAPQPRALRERGLRRDRALQRQPHRGLLRGEAALSAVVREP